MSYHCAISKCSNGSYRLKKWKKEICPVHAAVRESNNCDCKAPFCLWTIPTRKTKPVQRDKWKNLINRVHPATSKLLSPSKDQRICSLHFKDGRPTEDNPYPTQHLGYPQFEKKVNRVLMYEDSAVLPSTRGRRRETTSALPPDIAAVKENCIVDDPEVEMAVASEQQLGNHQLLLNCFTLFSVVLLLSKQMRSMFLQIVQGLKQCAKLEKQVVELKSALEEARKELRLKEESQPKPKVLKKKTKKKKTKVPPNIFDGFLTARNVNYYTGIESKAVVQILHDYVQRFVVRRWQGISKCSARKRNFTKTPARFGPSRFLRSIDELVLVLMRLRLGLDLRDLADRFQISASLAGKIFTSWIKGLAAVLKALVRMPDLETVLATKPLRYRSQPLTNLMAIIDCTEIFIETPQDMELQTLTWSDYKHHNTLKFLVAVCPNSYICYVSPAFEGRISDTMLVKKCEFLKLLPRGATIMADKGFSLAEDCAAHGVSVEIPPGRRGQSQMPLAAVKKTKKIANLRILVEQVINRLKNFKFLKYELALTSTAHMDQAIIVCAALSNLKGPVYTV